MSTYERFKLIVEEIDTLISKGVASSSPEFQAWKAKTERFLIKEYGQDSYEIQNFKKYRFTLSIYPLGTPNYEFVAACKRDLERVKAVFLTYLEEMQESPETVDSTIDVENFSSVFVVHGHNEVLKQDVARLIERQGLRAVILHEQPNQGATLIEKFENNSDVGAAICLFTADDTGKAKKEDALKDRARQNVVFEAGFFMGSLGRDRVIILAEQGIELPSDLKGVVYTGTSSWQLDVLRELRAMGFVIDYNKLD